MTIFQEVFRQGCCLRLLFMQIKGVCLPSVDVFEQGDIGDIDDVI